MDMPPTIPPGPRVVTRGHRVYFIDELSQVWRVFDDATGPPHAKPHHTVLRRPVWKFARGRAFVPRLRRGRGSVHVVSYWSLSPTGSLRDLPPEQRSLDPVVLATQLRPRYVRRRPRDMARVQQFIAGKLWSEPP